MKLSCFVPNCEVNNINSPHKIFVTVPKNRERRIRWYQAVGKSLKHVVMAHLVCCEDHFDLASDAKNWMFYKTLGKALYLKDNVVPHKFVSVNKKESQMTLSTKERKTMMIERFKLARHLSEQSKCSKVQSTSCEESENLYDSSENCEQDPLHFTSEDLADREALVRVKDQRSLADSSSGSFVVTESVPKVWADLKCSVRGRTAQAKKSSEKNCENNPLPLTDIDRKVLWILKEDIPTGLPPPTFSNPVVDVPMSVVAVPQIATMPQTVQAPLTQAASILQPQTIQSRLPQATNILQPTLFTTPTSCAANVSFPQAMFPSVTQYAQQTQCFTEPLLIATPSVVPVAIGDKRPSPDVPPWKISIMQPVNPQPTSEVKADQKNDIAQGLKEIAACLKEQTTAMRENTEALKKLASVAETFLNIYQEGV